MRCGLSLLLVSVGFLSLEGVQADGQKQVTLQGKILCAGCTLQETKTCMTVIQVQESGKTVTYAFKDKGSEEAYHEPVCGGTGKAGTVTGVVSVADGKRWITPTKVEYAKK